MSCWILCCPYSVGKFGFTMIGETNAPTAPDMQLANMIRLVMSNRFEGGYHNAAYLAGQLSINVLPMAHSTLPAITQPNPYNINNLSATPMQTRTQLIEIFIWLCLHLVLGDTDRVRNLLGRLRLGGIS